MKYPQEFSVKSIKEKAASLPDTFYGEECNISLKSQHITLQSAADGEPLRFDNFGISLCLAGEISSEVNLSPQTVSKGDFELFSPGTIYRLESISKECELIGIAISPYMLAEILPKEDLPFFVQVGVSSRTKLTEEEQTMFKEMSELYLKALRTYGESSGISKGIAYCILHFAILTFSTERAGENTSGSRADEICKRFISLLGQSGGTKRTIGWFAGELCVSEHYLSMAVKQSSGQTVKSLIDKAVITDIKVMLRHSELSVAQIADRLEFPSCSFMCKYFRAHTGTTPLHYRNGN